MEYFFRLSRYPKKDLFQDELPQLNLGRWKKALCLNIGNNEVLTKVKLIRRIDDATEIQRNEVKI